MHFIFFRLDNLTEELGSMRKQVEELYLFRYILIKKFLFVNCYVLCFSGTYNDHCLGRSRNDLVVRALRYFYLCPMFKTTWWFHGRFRLSIFRDWYPTGKINKVFFVEKTKNVLKNRGSDIPKTKKKTWFLEYC